MRTLIIAIVFILTFQKVIAQEQNDNILLTQKLHMLAYIMGENQKIRSKEAIDASLAIKYQYTIIKSNLDSQVALFYYFPQCHIDYISPTPYKFLFAKSGENLYRIQGFEESDIISFLLNVYNLGLYNTKNISFEDFCKHINRYIQVNEIDLEQLYKEEWERQKYMLKHTKNG
jgi:hypothetical protein